MNEPEVHPVPRPDWSPLPHEGCVRVVGKVLLSLPHLHLALLRFDAHGTIHEHAADIEIDVVCLEGEGMTSVGGNPAAIRAGESVRWPAGIPHRLWTAEGEMVTLMVEHTHAGPGRDRP